MKEEYYTPELGDLFLGYSCEIIERDFKLVDSAEPIIKWVNFKIEDSYDFNTIWDIYNEAKERQEDIYEAMSRPSHKKKRSAKPLNSPNSLPTHLTLPKYATR